MLHFVCWNKAKTKIAQCETQHTVICNPAKIFQGSCVEGIGVGLYERWLLHVASVHWFQRCSMIFQFSMIFHVLVCFDLMFQIWGRGPSESHLLAGQICKPNNASRLFGHLIISVSVTALGKVLRPIPPASFSRTAPMVGCWRLWFHAHPPEKEQAFIYSIYIYIIFA